MTPTPDSAANAMIAVLVGELRAELGRKLVGVAVFGSLATGAYEPGISDIDLVAALTGDLDDAGRTTTPARRSPEGASGNRRPLGRHAV